MSTHENGAAGILPLPIRLILGMVLFVSGFGFFPLFLVGGLMIWAAIEDIRDIPQRQTNAAEAAARQRRTVSINAFRMASGSVAETAFLDAMIDAYDLNSGPGALEGRGLRLRAQVPMGELRIYRSGSSSQYYADFLVDEFLVVEIDGAAYHSSPDAKAYDAKRDADMRADGYQVLRIPARTVFENPKGAVQLVQNARSKQKR